MPPFTITETARFFAVKCAYHPQMVAHIKSLPGARWDPTTKTWAIPRTSLSALEHFQKTWDGSQALEEVKKPYQSPTDITLNNSLGTPWGHQRKGLDYLWRKEAALIDLAMGSGKSRILVDYILNKDGIKKTLILCPRSVVGVWGLQLEKFAARAYQVALLDERAGTVAAKRDKAEHVLGEAKARDLPAIIVINYDSVWREPFGSWAIEAGFDVVAADECQRVGAAGSHISRFLYRLGRTVPVRVGLSGTPFQDKPLGVYGVYRFLDPTIFGTNFRKFQQTYCRMGGYGFYQVLGYINQDDMRERINRIRFHMPPEGLDLPSVTHTDIPLQLPLPTRKLYTRLANDFYAEVGEGDITAANAAVALIRLQQLTSGYVPTEEDEETGEENTVRAKTVITSLHTVKRDALVELLEDVPHDEPVVVACRFHYDLDQIHEAAKVANRPSRELSGRRNEYRVTLDGGRWLPPYDRASGGQVLALQIRAGSVGVDLTAASHAVCYSNTFSLGDYEQFLARIHRPGQTKPCHYFHLVMEGTVDEQIRKALVAKKDVLMSLLEVGT